MANIRAGVAYIDVRLGSIERFKREVEEKVEKVGADAGSKMGKQMGEKVTEKVQEPIKRELPKVAQKASRAFAKDFGGNLVKSGQVLRIGFVAWAIPAAVAAGPFIGAVLGAAIVAALPLGAMAAGIALVADHPKIKAAGKKLGKNLKKDFKGAAEPFVQPVLESMKILESGVKENMGSIKEIFKTSAGFVVPLANSIKNAFTSIITGVKDAIDRAKPIMDVLFSGIERIGKAIGEFFTKITKDPEAVKGMADALDDLIGIIVLVIGWLGNFIVSASRAYSQFKETWGAIKSWFDNTITPSLKRAGDQWGKMVQAIKDWWNGLPKWFKDRWNEISNNFKIGFNSAKTAVTVIGGAIINYIRGLPGRIIGALGDMAGRMYNAGWNAMMGFFRGLQSVAGGIIQRAREIANSVVSTIRNALSIFSPSRVMMKLGEYTMLGFEEGLKKNMTNINDYLPKGITAGMNVNFGSVKEPQMDRAGSSGALQIQNYYANDNVDPWRQAEDWYFLVSARGGVA